MKFTYKDASVYVSDDDMWSLSVMPGLVLIVLVVVLGAVRCNDVTSAAEVDVSRHKAVAAWNEAQADRGAGMNPHFVEKIPP